MARNLLRIINCAWDERTVTWSNEPAIDGPILASAGAVAHGQLVDLDVTSAVTGHGLYCFALENPTKRQRPLRFARCGRRTAGAARRGDALRRSLTESSPLASADAGTVRCGW